MTNNIPTPVTTLQEALDMLEQVRAELAEARAGYEELRVRTKAAMNASYEMLHSAQAEADSGQRRAEHALGQRDEARAQLREALIRVRLLESERMGERMHADELARQANALRFHGDGLAEEVGHSGDAYENFRDTRRDAVASLKAFDEHVKYVRLPS